MCFLQANGGRASLSTGLTCLFFIFFHLSVIAALRHNSLLACLWMDNVSKGLQLALRQADESGRRHANLYKVKKFSGRQEPARLAVEPDWLRAAAEVFN